VREAHYIFNSHALFHIAKEAAKNAATGASLQDNVVIAVVFSVVGAEAFINEAFEAASQFGPGESEQKRVEAFTELGRQIEGPLGNSSKPPKSSANLQLASVKELSPGEFIRQFQFKKHTDFVLAFGFYLERHSDLSKNSELTLIRAQYSPLLGRVKPKPHCQVGATTVLPLSTATIAPAPVFGK
jgi:hypothetical protein